jgi:hypothetical protein
MLSTTLHLLVCRELCTGVALLLYGSVSNIASEHTNMLPMWRCVWYNGVCVSAKSVYDHRNHAMRSIVTSVVINLTSANYEQLLVGQWLSVQYIRLNHNLLSNFKLTSHDFIDSTLLCLSSSSTIKNTMHVHSLICTLTQQQLADKQPTNQPTRQPPLTDTRTITLLSLTYWHMDNHVEIVWLHRLHNQHIDTWTTMWKSCDCTYCIVSHCHSGADCVSFVWWECTLPDSLMSLRSIIGG